MKNLVGLLLFVICLANLACNSKFTLSGLEAEALERYKEHLAKYSTVCGDSYYFKQEGGSRQEITRLKDFSFEVKAAPITDVDKLNQIEWHGVVFIRFKAMKVWDNYTKDTHVVCSNWSPPPNYDLLGVEAEKRRGTWNLGHPSFTSLLPPLPIECAAISECLSK